ncbi:MAG: hypothetical protein COC15_04570, partial [Legionellales bacterium]
MLQTRSSKIAIGATILALIVVVLGAYTRLTDSGLGCPDWPGCYGNFIAPYGDFEAHVEMLHRYIAGSLGLVILYLMYLFRNSQRCLSWSIGALVIFQAALGMWTVTEKLLPIVVSSHLVGGLAIVALLFLLSLKSIAHPPTALRASNKLLWLINTALLILMIQIILGGWTSTNYAALACPDFPTCYGEFFPELDLANVFVFDKFIPTTNARITIHMLHRFGALIITILLSILLANIFINKSKY